MLLKMSKWLTIMLSIILAVSAVTISFFMKNSESLLNDQVPIVEEVSELEVKDKKEVKEYEIFDNRLMAPTIVINESKENQDALETPTVANVLDTKKTTQEDSLSIVSVIERENTDNVLTNEIDTL